MESCESYINSWKVFIGQNSIPDITRCCQGFSDRVFSIAIRRDEDCEQWAQVRFTHETMSCPCSAIKEKQFPFCKVWNIYFCRNTISVATHSLFGNVTTICFMFNAIKFKLFNTIKINRMHNKIIC